MLVLVKCSLLAVWSERRQQSRPTLGTEGFCKIWQKKKCGLVFEWFKIRLSVAVFGWVHENIRQVFWNYTLLSAVSVAKEKSFLVNVPEVAVQSRSRNRICPMVLPVISMGHVYADQTFQTAVPTVWSIQGSVRNAWLCQNKSVYPNSWDPGLQAQLTNLRQNVRCTSSLVVKKMDPIRIWMNSKKEIPIHVRRPERKASVRHFSDYLKLPLLPKSDFIETSFHHLLHSVNFPVLRRTVNGRKQHFVRQVL